MKRRELLLGFGAACVAAAPVARAAGGRLMTAADVHVDKYPTVEAVRWMSRKIEAETNGRLAIRVFHAGQLGRESDTVELARFGALDITRVNFAPLTNPFPLTRLFALPYVFDSVEHMRRIVAVPWARRCSTAFERAISSALRSTMPACARSTTSIGRSWSPRICMA